MRGGVSSGSSVEGIVPQHHTVASFRIAHVESPEAETDSAFVMSEGEKEIARREPPVPSCPLEFEPVHHTVLLRIMQVCCEPAVTDEIEGVSMTPGPTTGSIADVEATGPIAIKDSASERVAYIFIGPAEAV